MLPTIPGHRRRFGRETSSPPKSGRRRGRRVFKSFLDNTTLKISSWFFYYDPLDRLTEVRYTPDTSVLTTYSLFQLFWLDDRLVLYWQTDYPSVTTSKRYVGTDESNRPVDMICWGVGNCPRVWSINPSAWGFDTNLIGPTVYQPVLFAGQYLDSETAAYHNDGLTTHRPGLVSNWFRTYDSFTGSYFQVDPLVDRTWSTYVYVESDPVGKKDPTGLLTRVPLFNLCLLEGGELVDCLFYSDPMEDMLDGATDGGAGGISGGIDPEPDHERLKRQCYHDCDVAQTARVLVCSTLWRYPNQYAMCMEAAKEAYNLCYAQCGDRYRDRPIAPVPVLKRPTQFGTRNAIGKEHGAGVQSVILQ